VRSWPQAAALGRALTQLCGAEAAVIGRSTLHLFWDLFGLFDPRDWSVIVDEHSYPVARWAASRMLDADARLREFIHLDVDDLAQHCRQSKRKRVRPLILTDSFCCVCGNAPSLGAYCDLARQYDGLVIMDDTQRLGLVGTGTTPTMPFGWGGGGSLPFHKLVREPIVAISSLAKALGSPTAVAVGPADIIARLQRDGDSRVHCSQPSAADMGSVAHALLLNKRCGDRKRAMLARGVEVFRTETERYGLQIVTSLHPTQSVYLRENQSTIECHRRLKERGIACLAGKGHRGEPRLVFLLTCRHLPQEIRQTIHVVADVTSAFRSDAVSMRRFSPAGTGSR